ncbi:MAG: DUF2156 domain-containing protein [Acidimicrobiaceae bacterium]|nr:DUF2156 domain-containing protein [Acidimicrobiaceae bacterium]
MSQNEKVLVISDLSLSDTIGSSDPRLSGSNVAKLVEALEEFKGDGHLIILGNLLDLGVSDSSVSEYETARAALDHNELVVSFIANFTKNHHGRVVVIPGLKDRSLAWDEELSTLVINRLGATFCLELEVRLHSQNRIERVLVASGREFDEHARASDPYSPFDTPWATHRLTDVLPKALREGPSLLWGAERLQDPEDLAGLAASRIVYSKVLKYSVFALLPIILTVLVRIPLLASLPGIGRLNGLRSLSKLRLELLAITSLIDIIVVISIILFLAQRVYSALSKASPTTMGTKRDLNIASRIGAQAVLRRGYKALIVAHSRQPELTKVGSGYFANPGGVQPILKKMPGRLGLPAAYSMVSEVTWLELSTNNTLKLELFGFTSSTHVPFINRIVASPNENFPRVPSLIASLPEGKDYDELDPRELIRFLRPRRIAHISVLALGIIDLASALTPPLRSRLRDILEFLPSNVATFADATTALIGVALLGLSFGISKGQRLAWAISTLAVAVGVISNLLKGGDYEEATALLLLLAFLLQNRAAFDQRGSREKFLNRIVKATAYWLLTLIIGTFSIWLDGTFQRHARRITIDKAVIAAASRMIASPVEVLPHLLNRFISPTLFTATIGIAIYLVAGLFLPYVTELTSEHRSQSSSGLTEREIVAAYSRGTLDYFALRDDKEHFVSHDTLIAYANYGSTCLISPDPIGPEVGAKQAAKELISTLRSRGKSIAVLGASQQWVDFYRSIGLHEYYIGDEAVVDVTSLSLEGKTHKGLRQAVNRIRKYGYTSEFCSPMEITPEVKDQILEVMTRSRKGDAERGFSMTLGRVADPVDDDILITCCKDPNGTLVGFCQWVPAPGIDGYSLDLMRRDTGEHPNGLIDFMIVETIEYLRARGKTHLSLNFATMRGVLAGERGDGITQRVEKMVLKRLSDSMQIESLWKFNSKFDPDWSPRYLIYDKLENLPSVLLSVAKAESFWEIPVIGRFLSQDQEKKTTVA